MSITYIIGSSHFFDHNAILAIAQKIVEEGRKNGITYKACDNFNDIKIMSYKEHVIRVKNSDLTYAEEEFLESYKGPKTLFLCDNITSKYNRIHDLWLLSYFNNVYLYNSETGNRMMIRRKSRL